MTRSGLVLITLFTALAAAPAASAQCPEALLVSQKEICYGSGGINTPQNIAQGVYTAPAPLAAGTSVCVHVDLVARIEAGGHDRVFLGWKDNTGKTQTDCLVGADFGDCASQNFAIGCHNTAPAVWNVDDTLCWAPTAGATSVTATVYVQPTDVLYQCGDDCAGPGLVELGVTVNELRVVGCQGGAVGGCGNGVVGAGEQCDDGNALAGDGCSQSCQREAGAFCNDAGTACSAKNQCVGIAPESLASTYCYANNDDEMDSPLTWTWTLPGTGEPVLLQWDVQGGAEFHGGKGDDHFDAVWVGWSDELGGGGEYLLQDGGLNFNAFGVDFVDMWSLGSLAITPTAGAKTLRVTVYVSTDGLTSCQEPKASLGPIPELFAESLTLTSCNLGVTQYDTLSAFTDAIGQCYVVHDFNAIADKTAGPFSGDGYVLTADTNKPGEQLTVSKSPYYTTQALGDGTPAIEAQGFGSYEYNSRLRVTFTPKPAVAVALNVIDAGDGDGVMALEAYRNGELVFVDNDIDASGPKNNFITWKGFVFAQPVDEVVFFMIESGDFFNVDNLIVIPQQDGDLDGVPNLCDCAPGDPAIAGTFPEICDDAIDNDCDGLTDGVDPDCGGGGTAACADYADVSFGTQNGGWLVSGDQSWAWSAQSGQWRAVGANGISSTLESSPVVVPASACAEDVKVTVDLGGAVQSPDALVVSYAIDGGAYQELETFKGALSPSTWSLPGVGPGDAVGFRFRFTTDGSGLGADPTVARLRVFSDADMDKDGVCDACDCAPMTPGFGFDCDQDGDGWCAAGAGELNADPEVAGCPEDVGGGTGTDCNDGAASANPGKTTESPLCSDQVDNDCDGKTDAADPDCAVATCTDKDNDGFGTGAGCLGPDCNDNFKTCTTDCSDVDQDGIPDCADPCIDQDKDGYGKGTLCAGPDCDDTIAACTTDCTTDADANGTADCAQPCVDEDKDGFGIGGLCVPDCDDTAATCTTDCSDGNNDGIPDCKAPGCVDPDGDGYGQGAECLGADCSEASALCTSDCTDTDDDGEPDCLDDDDDGDGLSDVTETGTTKTDPLDPDSDDDGLQDGTEVNTTKTDPNDPDTDGDDLLDGTEVNTTKTDPLDPDTDDDELEDGQEVNQTQTDPLDPDSDDDGLGDGQEVEGTTTNPLDPDTDDDGLLDGVEVNDTKTDPKDPDSDDDNLSDGTEVNDTKTDPLNPDTDADGLQDGDEVLIHETNPLDPDTDHGGVNDGTEVSVGQNPRNDPSDDFASGLIQGNGLSDCSAGGSGGVPYELLLALGILLFWRRRRWLLSGGLALAITAVGLLGTTPPARAADGFSIDLFQIQPGDDRVLSVKGSEVAPAWSPYGGFWIHYADDPLRLLYDIGGVRGEQRLVERRLTAQVGAGIGLFGFAEFQLGLPIVLKSKGDAVRFPEIDGPAAGDLDLGLRFRLLERRGADKQGFGLAAGLTVGVPVGSTDTLAGENGATIRPRVDLSLGLGPVLLALNLGVSVRTSSHSFQNLELDHDLTWGFGARWRATEAFALAAEVFGRTRLTDPFGEDSESPMELVGGPQVRVARGLTIEAGAGTGLVPGYGSPDWRVYGGVQWAEPVTGPADTDGDGFPDPEDGCPLQPEDFDGFEDRDGCPDPDNDQDGILDLTDRCPMDPEDIDQFEDADGCPDPDNDQDGILDVDDRCPMEPEDVDQFEDADGCPDPDNDQDGILDVDDKCPVEPETDNGYQDQDGCPDSVPLARIEECHIVIGEKVYFATAKAVIKPVSYPLLDAVAALILENIASFDRVDVEGHTDNHGSKRYNLRLSDRRAAAVRKYLIKKGVPPEKLRSEGFGFSRPVASNDTEEGRERNRRVGFEVVGGTCGD
ncbi:MAG: OmpA family protein [Deltaproteobacteria bacterium]|nr:OmpA family protein [Deltaproteobacteria bacterium]MCB9788690.1 OmpA family protein [Deltaproteobacteria bacterium]